jgi:excisionase family DNA binding protein
MSAAACQPPEGNPDPLYDVEQAGLYLGRGARFVRRLVHERRIAVVRIGGRVRIRRSALDAFLDAHTRPAERTGPVARPQQMPPPKPRKLTTEAAPTRQAVHTEPTERITPPVPPAKTGKSGKARNAGPAAG